MRHRFPPRFTEWMGYGAAALAMYLYGESGGGILVWSLFLGAVAAAVFFERLPLKPYLYGPAIVGLYILVLYDRGGLPVSCRVEGFLGAFRAFFLNMTIMTVVVSGIFFLYFKEKTPLGITVFNAYHLLLALALSAAGLLPGGRHVPAVWGLVFLVCFDGFFINRQAILEEFEKKKRAGREFVSGVIRGSRLVSVVVFLACTAGGVGAVGAAVYAVTGGDAWKNARRSRSTGGGLRVRERLVHDVSRNRPNLADMRVKMAVSVRYAGRSLKGLYMKGRSFDTYLWGGRWIVTGASVMYMPDAGGGIPLPRLYAEEGYRVKRRYVSLGVRLFMVETPEIFVMERPEVLYIPFSPEGCRFYLRGGLSFPRLPADLVTYSVLSSVPLFPGSEMAEAVPSSPAEDVMRVYLRVPARMKRLIALGRRIAAEEYSVRGRVERIRRFIGTRCRYVPEPQGRRGRGDPVEDFLFGTRRGVCVEFASAFVLLARAAGVPARYCTGYMVRFPETSEVVPEGKGGFSRAEEYVLRKRNAHAWGEIFVKGAGWIAVEAVPPAALDLVAGRGREGGGGGAPTVRRPGVRRAASGAGKPRVGFFQRFLDAAARAGYRRIRWTGLVLGGLLLGCAALMRVPGRRYRAALEKLGLVKKRITPVDFYNEYLLACERRNIRVRAGETALEFAARAASLVPPEDALFIAAEYHRVRYGRRSPSDPGRIKRVLAAVGAARVPGDRHG